MDGHGAAPLGHGEPGEQLAEGHEEEHIHLPGPSAYPFTLSLSLFIVMIGLLFFPHWGTSAGAAQWLVTIVVGGIGALGMIWSIIAWAIQISEA